MKIPKPKFISRFKDRLYDCPNWFNHVDPKEYKKKMNLNPVRCECSRYWRGISV